MTNVTVALPPPGGGTIPGFPQAGFVPGNGVLRQRQNAGTIQAVGVEADAWMQVTETLVGRVAVIVTGEAKSGSAAQARVRDEHGQTHYIMVEPDTESDVFAQGASVLLVRRAGATFFAIHNMSASLRDATV